MSVRVLDSSSARTLSTTSSEPPLQTRAHPKINLNKKEVMFMMKNPKECDDQSVM